MLLSVKKRLKLRIKRRKKNSDKVFKIKHFAWQKKVVCSKSRAYRRKKLKKKKFLLKKSFITKKKFKNDMVKKQYKILLQKNNLVKFFEIKDSRPLLCRGGGGAFLVNKPLSIINWKFISETAFYKSRVNEYGVRRSKFLLKS